MVLTLAAIVKFLTRSTSQDGVNIRAGDDPTELNVTFTTAGGRRPSGIRMKILSNDSDLLSTPDPEPDAVVVMPSRDCQRIFRAMAIVGDSVDITCSPNSIEFSAAGDPGTACVRLNAREDAIDPDAKKVSIQVTNTVTAKFTLRCMDVFLRAMSLSKEVKLSVTSSQLLLLELDINEIGHIKLLVMQDTALITAGNLTASIHRSA